MHVAGFLVNRRQRFRRKIVDLDDFSDGLMSGRKLLAFTRTQLPDEIHLRCAEGNVKAWRWYEREGFLFEKQEIEPMNGLMMKYYRWRRNAPS